MPPHVPPGLHVDACPAFGIVRAMVRFTAPIPRHRLIFRRRLRSHSSGTGWRCSSLGYDGLGRPDPRRCRGSTWRGDGPRGIAVDAPQDANGSGGKSNPAGTASGGHCFRRYRTLLGNIGPEYIRSSICGIHERAWVRSGWAGGHQVHSRSRSGVHYASVSAMS